MSRFLSIARRTASGWSVAQVSMLLTAVALALWAYSLVAVRLEIGHLGLISSFPAVFFVALGILTLAAVLLWVSPEKHHKLLFLQLMVLIVAVWLVPMLIGTRPYFGDAYGTLQRLGDIAGRGQLVMGGNLDWPGGFLVLSMLGGLGSTSLDSVINVSSFIMLLLYLPPLYVFLRNVLGESRSSFCWAGLWVFSLASWVPEGYFSPQGVAYLLFVIMLALMTTHGFWERNPRWLMLTISAGVVGSAIVLTHLLTSMLMVGTLTITSAAKRSLRAVPTIVVVTTLAVVWNAGIIESVKTRTAQAPLFTRDAPAADVDVPPAADVRVPPAANVGILSFDIESMVERQVLDRVSGSRSHVDVARVRMAFSALVAVMAVAGVIYLLVKRQRRTALLLMAIAVVPFLLLPISGRNYEVAYVTRMYFFLVPVMACAAVFLLDVRRRLTVPILWIICAAAIPLTMIAQYGNQATDRWSPSYQAGVSYFDRVRAARSYPVAWLGQAGLKGDQVVLDAGLLAAGHYFPVSEHDDVAYAFKYEQPDFVDGVWAWLRNSGEHHHIYTNPEYSLYVQFGSQAWEMRRPERDR